MQEIGEFIDDLLDEKGLKGLDEDSFLSVKDNLEYELLQEINSALILSLPEKEVEQLSKMYEDPNFKDEEAIEFIKQNNPDFEKVIQETKKRFRELYLGKEELENGRI